MQFTTAVFFLALKAVLISAAPTVEAAAAPAAPVAEVKVSNYDPTTGISFHDARPIQTRDVTLAQTCIGSEFNNCKFWTTTSFPLTGACQSTSAAGQQDNISSIRVIDANNCIFYDNSGCSGTQFKVNRGEAFGDLRNNNFNDRISSFRCF